MFSRTLFATAIRVGDVCTSVSAALNDLGYRVESAAAKNHAAALRLKGRAQVAAAKKYASVMQALLADAKTEAAQAGKAVKEAVSLQKSIDAAAFRIERDYA